MTDKELIEKLKCCGNCMHEVCWHGDYNCDYEDTCKRSEFSIKDKSERTEDEWEWINAR